LILLQNSKISIIENRNNYHALKQTRQIFKQTS
jgi:hypothetical protein